MDGETMHIASTNEKETPDAKLGEEKKKQQLQGHPWLSTWRPSRLHHFTAIQFEVLTAICDTIIPSLPPPIFEDGEEDFQSAPGVSKDDIRKFYALKASDEGVIDVKGLERSTSIQELGRISKVSFRKEGGLLLYTGYRGVKLEPALQCVKQNPPSSSQIAAALESAVRPERLEKLLGAIGLLSTGWGTLLLGLLAGVVTLSPQCPFFPTFARLSVAKRERILRGWSQSSLQPLQAMFKVFKSVTGWAFYSKLDENGENPAWKAIGYTGPDPVVKNRPPGSYEQIQRPLGDKHIDIKVAAATAGEGKLKQLLTSAGCSLIENFDDLRHLATESSSGTTTTTTTTTKESANPIDIGMQCDVVIVGSGAGGGVMAATLAKQGLKVIVLERGPYFAAGDITTLEGPGMLHMYEKGGTQATDDGGVALIAGRVLGGGTAVNWSVCFKTPDNVRDEWAVGHGLGLFTTERYDRAMQAVWERLRVQPATDQHSPQNLILQAGAEKLGFRHGTLDRNCASDHYCGWCSYGCPTGKKQSTAETWLVDAVRTNNAVVISNCNVERVLHDEDAESPGELPPRAENLNGDGKKSRRVRGVLARTSGGDEIEGSVGVSLFVKARAVVVACGALMTPPLLLNSGLKNGNIGKYLRVHPASTCWGFFPEGVGPEGRFYEGGIMTTFSPVATRKPNEYGGLLETGVFHPSVFAAFHPWQSGADGKERLMRHSRTSHITVVTRDKDSGCVRVDKHGIPKLQYTISSYDEESLVAGLVQSLRILIAAGAVEVGTQQLEGERFKAQGASAHEIEAYILRVQRLGAKNHLIQIASAHQLGSCRMGINPSISAVDPRGETWEVEGLFVGDGSVLPTSSGVNPMVTIQSIAYCTADSVLQFLKPRS